MDIESETEPNISITWNSHISPIKADIIDNDEHDEEEHNHQITNKFKETVTDIDPVKIVLAEILIEEKDTVIQWNKVEIWKSDATSNNTSLSSLIEEGIDALKFNWLDTDEEPDKDIFWDAESCKLDMHMDCESESEEEIFWDSLSQLEEEIETVKGVNRDMSETFMNDEKYKFNNGPFKEVWDNIYKTETFEDVPKLSKDSKKREVRSRKRIYSKIYPIFCHYRTGCNCKRNWRNGGTE